MLSAVCFYDASAVSQMCSMNSFVRSKCVPLENGACVTTYSFETDEFISVMRVDDDFVVASTKDGSWVREMIVGYINIYFPSA